MFPIGDQERVPERAAFVNWAMLALNIAVFLLFEVTRSGPALQSFIETWGAVPREITSGQDWHTLLTSMFLHGGWMHLIGNMLFLWVFGDNVETIMGHIPYLIFYLVAGLVAALAQVLASGSSAIPLVGASGAISGVLGAYLVMFPENRVKMLVLGRAMGVTYVSALVFLAIWGVTQLVNSVGSLVMTQETGGVAYLAHLGGFVVGLVVGFLLRSRAQSLAAGQALR